MKVIKNDRGQGLVEYMVIVALMAVASMGIMRVLSQNTDAKLAQITQAIRGDHKKRAVHFDEIKDEHIRKKDMSDFMVGSSSRKKKQ